MSAEVKWTDAAPDTTTNGSGHIFETIAHGAVDSMSTSSAGTLKITRRRHPDRRDMYELEVYDALGSPLVRVYQLHSREVAEAWADYFVEYSVLRGPHNGRR